MSTIALRLQATLASLDVHQASVLERLVEDALELVSNRSSVAVGANGWPVGHFEKYAGIFANEPFDVPEDPLPSPNIAAIEKDW